MRTENIKLKAQINTMTREKEDTEDKIKELEKDLENNKNKITNQREVIDSLHKTCESKEQQEQTIKE